MADRDEPDDPTPYFTGDRHALFVGAILGIALKHGLPLEPVIDADGNYTAWLTLRVDEHVRIRVIVPPPPADWTLETWLTMPDPERWTTEG